MGFDEELPGIRLSQCEPKDWYICFHEETPRRWVRWLAFGRFKHVSCFGYVERAGAWVFYDFHLDRARIYVVRDFEADVVIGHYASKNTVVRMARPAGGEDAVNLRPGLWCVAAVVRILGIRSSALRPDTLFRHCLANGGEIIKPEGCDDEGEGAGRSRDAASATGSGTGEGRGDPAEGSDPD